MIDQDWNHPQIRMNEPLAKHTYYRIGGPARLFAVPKSLDDLVWLKEKIKETKISYFFLGKGSNILASDDGYDGLIIKASQLSLDIVRLAENKIRVGSSVAVSTLLRRAGEEGWGGLEFLTGVPGSIGGAVFMNAGTHLGEVQSRLIAVDIFDLKSDSNELMRYSGEQLRFEYRKNFFLNRNSGVVSADWEITPEDPNQVKTRINDLLQRRKATQPIEYPSCGSVFKNPRSSGKHAWQVIDQLGLRGYRVGDAQFSEKHSNFIINLGHAKASDVRHLIEAGKQKALQDLGIELQEEVIYI